MRPWGWTIVLLTLTFAIGWTARGRLGAGPVEPDAPVEAADPARAGRPERGDRIGGPFGRFLDSVRQFSVELALAPEQERAVGELVDEAVAEIRTHEARIHDVTEEARARLRSILTEEQRTSLDRLVDERFRQRSEQKVARTLAWAREEFALDDGRAARLESALREHEEAKRCLFRFRDDPNAEPAPTSHEERQTRLGRLRDALKERLEGVLDEAQQEEFLRRSAGRRGFGPERDLVE